jgi:hypothetical protein
VLLLMVAIGAIGTAGPAADGGLTVQVPDHPR